MVLEWSQLCCSDDFSAPAGQADQHSRAAGRAMAAGLQAAGDARRSRPAILQAPQRSGQQAYHRRVVGPQLHATQNAAGCAYGANTPRYRHADTPQPLLLQSMMHHCRSLVAAMPSTSTTQLHQPMQYPAAAAHLTLHHRPVAPPPPSHADAHPHAYHAQTLSVVAARTWACARVPTTPAAT